LNRKKKGPNVRGTVLHIRIISKTPSLLFPDW
jgi:hypothetical protein